MIELFLLWAAWCVLHSLLISGKAHQLADRILGQSSGIYRIAYILFSIITLVPVLWYQFSLPQKLLIQPNLPLRLAQATLLIYGLLMFYLGARIYNMRHFLGIAQWQNASKKKKTDPLPFHTDGVLAWVRHPWYSGGIALIWGFGAVTDIFLLTRGILTTYLVIGTILEEKRLKTELGEDFKAYSRKVPMLVPRKPKQHE